MDRTPDRGSRRRGPAPWIVPAWITERSEPGMARRTGTGASGHARDASATTRTAKPSRDSPRYARPAMARIDLRTDTVTHPTARHAPRDGRGRGRRRRVRRRPDGQRASRSAPPSCSARRPACSSPAGTMGNLVASVAHLAARPGDDRRREHHTLMRRGRPATRSSSAPRSAPLERPARRHDRPGGDRRDAFARPGRPPRADHRRSSSLENTHAHSMGQPLTADVHRGTSPRSRTHTACRSTSTARASGTPSSRSACPPARPRRPGRHRSRSACPRASRCPVGLRRRRPRAVHRARAPRAQDGRRRHAPGRASSPRPAWSRSATARTA